METTNNEPDWIDVFLNNNEEHMEKYETFESMWEDTKALAKKLDLPVWYVEEEFIIDGHLYKDTY